jgi:two-component system, chemotaxis family, chemotaxis protein CheY
MATKTVLVVDDAAVPRTTIKAMLTKHGFDVVGEAQNGVEAVEKYKELSPNLVTMVTALPEMDGIAAVKAIVALDPAAKIVMVASMGQQTRIVEAIAAGAKSFITKPFLLSRVLKTIGRVLAH